MKKQIKGYQNYWIYDNGDVFNASTQKMLKGNIGENGYKYYRLSLNNKKTLFYAHRLVAEYFVENPENKPVVNHIDGNKLNNDKNNLEWVSYSENTIHWHQLSQKRNYRKSMQFTGDLPEEIWVKIKNFDNYSVSSQGRVRNDKKNILLRPSITNGYYKVRLSHQGNTKDYFVHILVYTAFSHDDNLVNYVIDHIDGDKLNNQKRNLRKISLSENVKAALYQTHTNKATKQVIQLNQNGEILSTYPSVREAARVLKLDASTISKVCRGENKTHGGFIFKYLK